ncbi:MAG: ACT domain-containing protein [Lachnospiraceae bacterium]|nr:ACT domain-containing protein [Lachnospiraceae bacterium]
MSDTEKYYIVKKKAVPEVLLKVVEAKHLLDSTRALTVQEAIDKVGISRSSFYKYKDDIFPFHDNSKGKTITFMVQMDDTQGLLSVALGIIAKKGFNILTIHQTVPVNGIATVTLSIEVPFDSEETTEVLDSIEKLDGIHYMKILARE